MIIRKSVQLDPITVTNTTGSVLIESPEIPDDEIVIELQEDESERIKV